MVTMVVMEDSLDQVFGLPDEPMFRTFKNQWTGRLECLQELCSGAAQSAADVTSRRKVQLAEAARETKPRRDTGPERAVGGGSEPCQGARCGSEGRQKSR